jgi:hypothetical protein
MRRQFALSSVVTSLLLLQLTIVCNGRATNNREDELASLAKRLKSMIVDKKNENTEVSDVEQDSENEDDLGLHSLFDSQRDSRDSGLSHQQKKKVIAMHNKLRAGEKAADMQRLKYNDKLAELAQEWADKCGWGHRLHDSFQPGDYGFKTVGENIWAWSDDSKKIPDQPIQDWFDEKYNYDFDGPSCRKEPCGHYTAVTWASTREVGCGLAKCRQLQGTSMNDAIYFVCNYGPGGNDNGKRPYTKGEPCSACSTGQFFCTNGLCDDDCSSEKHDGSCKCKAKCGHGKETSHCKCDCESGYTGVACDEECKDKDPQCGANPGWPQALCTDKTLLGGFMYDTVNKECPKMCGHCDSKKRVGEEVELLKSLQERMAEAKK